MDSEVPALYPYQVAAVDKIVFADKPILNSFDPGLGKTRVAIEVLRLKGFRRVLVLCPNSALLVWQREIERWWPDGPDIWVGLTLRNFSPGSEGVCIVSYGLVSETSGEVAKLLDKTSFQATILDEAHYLKNPTSNRSKRIFKLLPRLGWVHPMTGTPAPNHAGELWGLVRHLRPDLIVSPLTKQPMYESEFQSRYCEVSQIRIKTKNGGHRFIEQITGSQNLKELRDRLRPMLIQARKKDVLPDLPPLDFVVLPVMARAGAVSPVPGGQEYDDDQYLALASKYVKASDRQELGLAKVDAIVEWIVDLLDSDPKRRLVLWAIHHSVIDRYHQLLAQYSPVKFDGRDSLAERQSAVQRFMSGTAKIFIGQIQAGGTALTLVSPTAKCSDVLFAESSFSPSDNFQAACRVHRIGQHDGVLARFTAAAGTYDDRVQDILSRKARELTELFG